MAMGLYEPTKAVGELTKLTKATLKGIAHLKSPKHPESVNYDSLEAVTLMRTFTPPLIFVTARGMKKVDTFNHDTYTIHTNVGTLKKYQMLFTFQLIDAENFEDNMRINRKIEAKKLRTRYHIAKRPPNVLTDDMLIEAAGQPIRCVPEQWTCATRHTHRT